MKLNNIPIGSGAKAPQTKTDGDINNYNIQFKKFSREELECGDYVPRIRETKEAQLIENERVSKNIDTYISSNEKLIKALDILQTSFTKVAKEIIEADQNKKLKFTVCKDRKLKDVAICSIKQSSRFDEKKREDVPLDAAIFRIKLPVYKEDGRIGQWDRHKDEFRDIVFDARRMTKKNGFKAVPAYVKKDKKKIPLSRTNVQGFITYKSVISGSINFDSATISKSGISLGNKFYEMYIIRHRTTNNTKAPPVEEIINLRSGLASDDEGSDEEINGEDGETENKDRDSDDEHEDDDKQAVPKPSEDPGNDTSEGEDLEGDKGDEDDKEVIQVVEKPKRIRKGATLKKVEKPQTDKQEE